MLCLVCSNNDEIIEHKEKHEIGEKIYSAYRFYDDIYLSVYMI